MSIFELLLSSEQLFSRHLQDLRNFWTTLDETKSNFNLESYISATGDTPCKHLSIFSIMHQYNSQFIDALTELQSENSARTNTTSVDVQGASANDNVANIRTLDFLKLLSEKHMPFKALGAAYF